MHSTVLISMSGAPTMVNLTLVKRWSHNKDDKHDQVKTNLADMAFVSQGENHWQWQHTRFR